MRIAFVHQPQNIVVPPVNQADAVALWTERVARGLRQDYSIVWYSQRGPDQAQSAIFEGIEHKRIEWRYDRYLRYGRALDILSLIPSERSFFAPSWFFRHYGERIATDLQSVGAEVVHVHNFSQFIPRIKRRNPLAKVVLHMHANWLVELDRRWLRPRLAAADAIVCCSGYYANAIREAWPDFASRVHVVYNGVDPEELVEIDELFPRPGGLTGYCLSGAWSLKKGCTS